MTLLLLAALQACVPDCPTSMFHMESVAHTQGKACPTCAAPIDVCFALCKACASTKGVCRGCGGKAVVPEKVWKPAQGGAPGIRLLPGGVVAVTRGMVLQSMASRFVAVREFDDRLVMTFSSRTPPCGSEPHAFDALHVRLPRTPGKKVIVEHVRHELLGKTKITRVAEFAPLD